MSIPKTPPYENIPRTAITEWLPKTVENIAWMAAEVARLAPNDPIHLYAIVISKSGTHAVIAKYKKKATP